MGEQFQRRQAKRFRHQHDAAYRSTLAQDDLLRSLRPDILAREITCESPPRDQRPCVGSEVTVVITQAQGAVVLDGNVVVGYVDVHHRTTADDVLGACGGIATARVMRHSPISGFFDVQFGGLLSS